VTSSNGFLISFPRRLAKSRSLAFEDLTIDREHLWPALWASGARLPRATVWPKLVPKDCSLMGYAARDKLGEWVS
jgi:hypothetical protein